MVNGRGRRERVLGKRERERQVIGGREWEGKGGGRKGRIYEYGVNEKSR